MILLGLIGQSCAGKNEAGKILEKYGWTVIDADAISRSIFCQCEKEILALFKDDGRKHRVKIEKKDGFIDKKVFSSFLFSNTHLLKKMEDFILPKISFEIEAMINDILKQNANAKICLNAPTLHKTLFFERCSYIFYIKANYFVRFFRSIKRDGFCIFNIYKRFLSQSSFDSQYITKKTDILPILNSASIKKFEENIKCALNQIGLL